VSLVQLQKSGERKSPLEAVGIGRRDRLVSDLGCLYESSCTLGWRYRTGVDEDPASGRLGAVDVGGGVN